MATKDELGIIINSTNDRGLITNGEFTQAALPTTANKFAQGCILIGGNGKVYTNAGTPASPSFQDINDVATSEIADEAVTRAKLSAVMQTSVPYTVKKSITSPQLLALNTTPIEVIAAPGAGKAIQVLGAFIAYTYVTAAYATNTTLLLVNENGTNEIATDGGSLISDTANNKGYMTISGGLNSIVTNDAVVIETQTGDPTAGSGTIDVYVTYQIITL